MMQEEYDYEHFMFIISSKPYSNCVKWGLPLSCFANMETEEQKDHVTPHGWNTDTPPQSSSKAHIVTAKPYQVKCSNIILCTIVFK